jgi:flagellar hook-length control protein FliK
MFEFITINSQDSSGYNKNQGKGNISSKPETDFYSMILSHSEKSSEKEPVREQVSSAEKNHDDYNNGIKSGENRGNEIKEPGEKVEKSVKHSDAEEKVQKEDNDSGKIENNKSDDQDEIREVKTGEKKVEKEKDKDKEDDGRESAEAIINKITIAGVMDLLESENIDMNISEEDMAGIIKSLLSGKDVKEAVKSALEEFSMSGNLKDLEKNLTAALKKIPDSVIEEAVKKMNHQNNETALNADNIKKIIKKAVLQQSSEGKKEIAASKGRNVKLQGEAADVKIDNNTVNSDKIKQAVIENEGSAGKKSFNEKGDNKEGFNFSYNKSDISGKRFNDQPEIKGKSPEFKQSLQDIIDKARVSVRDNRNATFNVKLYPRELGNVNVNLSLENGVVTAKFFVDSDEAKNQLSQNMNNLKQQMLDAGIEVGEFNVGVNDNGKGFLNDNENGGKKELIQFPEGKELLSAASIYDGNSSVLNSNSINVVI